MIADVWNPDDTVYFGNWTREELESALSANGFTIRGLYDSSLCVRGRAGAAGLPCTEAQARPSLARTHAHPPGHPPTRRIVQHCHNVL